MWEGGGVVPGVHEDIILAEKEGTMDVDGGGCDGEISDAGCRGSGQGYFCSPELMEELEG